MINLKPPKFVLTAIAGLTLTSCLSVGALCGVFAVEPVVTFLIGSGIGVIGLYTYYRVAIMLVMVKIIRPSHD